MRLTDEWKKFPWIFWLILNCVLYIDMKNCKNIAYTDFVNVIMALDLHFYKEK